MATRAKPRAKKSLLSFWGPTMCTGWPGTTVISVPGRVVDVDEGAFGTTRDGGTPHD
jgi:hypothetical protein